MLKIKSDGTSPNTEITIDGHPITNCTRLIFDISAGDRPASVRMDIEGDVEFDVDAKREDFEPANRQTAESLILFANSIKGFEADKVTKAMKNFRNAVSRMFLPFPNPYKDKTITLPDLKRRIERTRLELVQAQKELWTP